MSLFSLRFLYSSIIANRFYRTIALGFRLSLVTEPINLIPALSLLNPVDLATFPSLLFRFSTEIYRKKEGLLPTISVELGAALNAFTKTIVDIRNEPPSSTEPRPTILDSIVREIEDITNTEIPFFNVELLDLKVNLLGSIPVWT